jgi:[protein-PII] uridylyltransferase
LVDLIRNRLRELDPDFLNNPTANENFLELLRSKGATALALNSCMKIGFLEYFIPEFAWIRFLPQFDVYHQYTVDLHTIAVLENMDLFAQGKTDDRDSFLSAIFNRLENQEVLYLAGLFHDIAKGRGPGHEVRGEQIAAPVLKRLGLSPESIEEVCFLIRNHLAMTHLAFRKDLHDEALIARFAENIMSKRRLDLLILLTHADLRAVGPTAINSWRKMLLEELYYRTLDIIEGEGHEGEELEEWIKQIKSVVREMIPEDYRAAELDQYLAKASSRYFLDFYPGVISEHILDYINLLRREHKTAFENGDLIARKVDHKRPGYSSITTITKDRSGLFFRIAGTLTSNRINILGAWTHSIGDIAVSTFHVNDIPEGVLDDPDRWDHFKADLQKVLSGEIDVDVLVSARRRAKRFIPGSSMPRFPVKVEIDNAASDRATIIEVYAHDRPGLLYDITRNLSALNLDIILAKITTEIDQAADIFYVQNAEQNKIVDFNILDQIKDNLHSHLSEMESIHFSNTKDGAFSF